MFGAFASITDRLTASVMVGLAPALAYAHGYYLSYVTVRRVEEVARPRVLFSTHSVVKVSGRLAAQAHSRPAQLICQSPGCAGTLAGSPSDLMVGLQGLTASFQRGQQRSEPLDLAALDYVTSVYVLRLGTDHLPHSYVTVVNGRATGRRSMVAILSADLRLLHAELLERWWPLQHNPVCADSSSPRTRFQTVSVGCEPGSSISFRIEGESNND